MKATVHFNEGLINLTKPLAIIRAAAGPCDFRLLCSSGRAARRLQRYCDGFEPEPSDLSEHDYVAWCLNFAERHGVDVLWPGRHATALAAARERFAARGVHVLSVAAPATLRLLASKATLYERLRGAVHPLPVGEGRGEGLSPRDHASIAKTVNPHPNPLPPGEGTASIRIPAFRLAHDLASFDAAVQALSQQHKTICYKPAVSIYGVGFHVLATNRPWQRRLRAGDPLAIALEDARRKLAAQKSFAPTIVMEYLPGPERSVDCLAWNGELLRCIVRKKPRVKARGQLIERHAEIEAAVAAMTRDLGLHGVFNVQFRDSGGVPYLLEINPRMSGGLRFACASGVALPYWALCLAVGAATPGEIPHPRVGMRVGINEVATSR